MSHPLVGNLEKLKDIELQEKINDLTNKYWRISNSDVQIQIQMVLEAYNNEMQRRQSVAWEKFHNNEKRKSLDKLINVT